MSPRSVFITGTNRGIGLELVKQYLKSKSPPSHLFATCRQPEKAEELQSLAKDHQNLHILPLDITDHKSFPDVVKKVSEVVEENGLNLLINNAGVLSHESNAASVNADDMRRVFEANTFGPFFFTQAMLPLVRSAAKKNASAAMFCIDRAAVVMMSTAVASVAENSGGGIHSYRSSKTALNMLMKNYSIELKPENILVMSMHPGWVKTDMGGPNAQITTEQCCSEMLKTLELLGEKDQGAFLRYNNTPIQW